MSWDLNQFSYLEFVYSPSLSAIAEVDLVPMCSDIVIRVFWPRLGEQLCKKMEFLLEVNMPFSFDCT